MTDAEVIEMRDQIAKELDTDPMDGGIVLPDAGDGITRYPQDGGGAALGADDLAKLQGEVPPEGGEEEEPKDDEDDEDDQGIDSGFIVKKGKKK